MLIIIFTDAYIKGIEYYASQNYHKYYKRMYHDPANRIRALALGKLGEEAVAQYLGVSADYSNQIDSGYDLEFMGLHIAIKTKGVSRFPRLDGWYCHIPSDQYDKMSKHSDLLVACMASKRAVWILGFLPIVEVEALREWHQAGTRLEDNFVLPAPDSWGIKYSAFRSVDILEIFRQVKLKQGKG